MALISIYKVVSSVPASLDANAVYLVRTGTGFDLYVSDSTGSVAYQINSSAAGLSNIVEDTTPQLGGDLDLNGNDITGTGNISITGEIEADIHIGSLRGEIQFKAKAGEALTKGDPVYISSYDSTGNTPIVAIADANDSAKMPCFGLANESVSLNSSVNVVTFGTLSGIDTSGFSLGDTLYISNTGTLTNSKPTGESSLIQNIGKVQRVDNAAGSVKVGGAGRTNDVPNLNQGNVFIGNASNQAETRGLTLDDIAETPTNKHFTSGDESKLNGIESGATADQTDAEIKTAYENNANTNAFTDADESKLDGIEAGADVTDTINVTAAGALMDSELANEAAVKTLNQGVATTDNPSFAGISVTGTIKLDGDHPLCFGGSALGGGALTNNTTGALNSAVGFQALGANTTGYNNSAYGAGALYANTTGYDNTAFGAAALRFSTGANNTALGKDAGLFITTGSKNTIIGSYNGNQNGLDLRTSSNNIVLSDGDGNIRMHINSNGDIGISGTLANRNIAADGAALDALLATNFGKVLQVVDTQYDTTWAFTNTSYVDTTGFTASITPSSTTSKILILCSVFGGIDRGATVLYRLNRDGTPIGENPNNTFAPAFMNSFDGGLSVKQLSRHMLDSPATTSPVVYQFQHRVDGGIGFINRHIGGVGYGGQSNLTLIEIAG